MTDRPESVSSTAPSCAQRFRLRTLTLQPRDAIDYVQADWADAIVLVECGVLEVECRTGRRVPFGAGAALAFDGLPLRRLRNAGETPLVVHALSRARRSSADVRSDR